MPSTGYDSIVPTVIDEAIIEFDIQRLPKDSLVAFNNVRKDIKRNGGLDRSRLKPCDEDHRDGTQLVNCVKYYVPQPAGNYGLVLNVVSHPTLPWALGIVAYGRRHYPPESHRPNVYQVADLRLRDQK